MPVNQKGFTLVEELLIFIIVVIIGGTGFYVYQSGKQADKNLQNSSTNAKFAKKGKRAKQKMNLPLQEKKGQQLLPLQRHICKIILA